VIAPSNLRQRARHEPLFDIHPLTGASIEVFYADRRLETFGRGGSGWFWWSRQPGFAPTGPAHGPFPTPYTAYRDALGTLTYPTQFRRRIATEHFQSDDHSGTDRERAR